MPCSDARRFRPRLRAPAALVCAAAALAACAQGTEERYRATLQSYIANGFMRAETAPPDAPFGNAELIRNFERIAFHKEFADTGLKAEATPVELVKWTGPVRWMLTGDGVRPADERAFVELVTRLEGLTGLEFRRVEREADVFVLIAGREGRRAFVAALEQAGLAPRMRLILEWARNDTYPCVGQVGRTRGREGWVNKATIAIKDETRGLLRRSCIHEELVQTLGLLNDDAGARPSIFNDDQEFALLTRHDEYLLRILYDPRLEYGMTAGEGMPVVRRIVEEIGPGPARAPRD
jgi:hypothetical protein